MSTDAGAHRNGAEALTYEKRGYQPSVGRLNPVPPKGGSGVPPPLQVAMPNTDTTNGTQKGEVPHASQGE